MYKVSVGQRMDKHYYIEGIMPEGHINKMTDLQVTKFLHLFVLTNVHY
jgi:hypothetical protein